MAGGISSFRNSNHLITPVLCGDRVFEFINKKLQLSCLYDVTQMHPDRGLNTYPRISRSRFYDQLPLFCDTRATP